MGIGRSLERWAARCQARWRARWLWLRGGHRGRGQGDRSPSSEWPRPRRRFLPALLLVLALLSVSLSMTVMDRAFRPHLEAIIDAEIRRVAAEALNEAVNPDTFGSLRYQDLIHVEISKSGDRVLLLMPDTVAINLLADRASRSVHNHLQKLREQPLQIPLAQIMGWTVFGDMGPRLRVRVVPLGSAVTRVRSKLEAAGINQTHHVLTLETTVTLRAVVPLVSRDVSVTFEAPLTSAVINGPVPSVNLQWPASGLPALR